MATSGKSGRPRVGTGGTDTASLFAGQTPAVARRPLADRLRPKHLDAVVGQPHLVGPGGVLTSLLAAQHLPSLILWGPPGTGKTTLARLLAGAAGLEFAAVSAVFSGVADLKAAFETARAHRAAGRGTLLFVDEIHRFNRAQQDGFLPAVEDGTVILVGATTENPSFALVGALLSRARVLVLHRLDAAALEILVQRAELVEGRPLPVTSDARAALCALADGDGRYLLNLAESLFALAPQAPLDPIAVAAIAQRRAPLHDRQQESHYNLISALHKAMRGSDVDAALYWLARMLAGGEDPHFIARRLVRFAAEDIGLADASALPAAIAAWQAYERLGSPEGELALAQAVVHLATAPKSNAVYAGFKAAQRLAAETGSLPPPAHALNAPTRLMRDLGYGAGYRYDHDTDDAFAGVDYFPSGLPRQPLYTPSRRGGEAAVAARVAEWARLREARATEAAGSSSGRSEPAARGSRVDAPPHRPDALE